MPSQAVLIYILNYDLELGGDVMCNVVFVFLANSHYEDD